MQVRNLTCFMQDAHNSNDNLSTTCSWLPPTEGGNIIGYRIIAGRRTQHQTAVDNGDWAHSIDRSTSIAKIVHAVNNK